MSIGNNINNLVIANLQNWHFDTQLKDANGDLREDLTLTDKEVEDIFMKARISNRKRSESREDINDYFNQGTGETKINYYGEKNGN